MLRRVFAGTLQIVSVEVKPRIINHRGFQGFVIMDLKVMKDRATSFMILGLVC